MEKEYQRKDDVPSEHKRTKTRFSAGLFATYRFKLPIKGTFSP